MSSRRRARSSARAKRSATSVGANSPADIGAPLVPALERLDRVAIDAPQLIVAHGARRRRSCLTRRLCRPRRAGSADGRGGRRGLEARGPQAARGGADPTQGDQIPGTSDRGLRRRRGVHDLRRIRGPRVVEADDVPELVHHHLTPGADEPGAVARSEAARELLRPVEHEIALDDLVPGGAADPRRGVGVETCRRRRPCPSGGAGRPSGPCPCRG